MKDIAALGVNTVRVWLFADGRAGLKFDNAGFVVGVDEAFLADFDELVRLARSAKIYLIPVLFDFLMAAEGKTAAEIVNEKGLVQIADPAAVSKAVEEALEKNPKVVAEFKSGKEAVLGFLVGQVMKATGGSANPKEAGRLLRSRLSA